MDSRWLARDAWFGDDKVSHLGWGALVASLLMHAGASVWWYVGLMAAAAVSVELVELWRYRAWERRGRVGAWPFLCDLFSYKDVAWALAGGVVAPPLVFLAQLVGLLIGG